MPQQSPRGGVGGWKVAQWAMRARYLHTITLITHTPRHCAPPSRQIKSQDKGGPKEGREREGGERGEAEAVGQGVPKVFWYFEHVLTQLMHSLWRLLPKSVARAQISKQMDKSTGRGERGGKRGQLDTRTAGHLGTSVCPSSSRSLLYIFVTSVDHFFSHYKALRILNLLGQRSKSLRKIPTGKPPWKTLLPLSACKRCKRERTKDQLKLSLTNDMEIIRQMGKFTKCENARKFSINFV